MDNSGEDCNRCSNNESPKPVLQILFEIGLADDCHCPLSSPEFPIDCIHNQIDDETCHAEIDRDLRYGQ
jgi:hypothetical protein